jgi:hypothetical protein
MNSAFPKQFESSRRFAVLVKKLCLIKMMESAVRIESRDKQYLNLKSLPKAKQGRYYFGTTYIPNGTSDIYPMLFCLNSAPKLEQNRNMPN